MKNLDIQTKKIELNLPRGIRAEVNSDTLFHWDQETNLLIQAYIPGVQRVEPSNQTKTLMINHLESQLTQLDYLGLQANLKQEWNGKVPLDLLHLLYSMSRISFLANNYFPTHSACVENDEGAVLIVGHSGVGKTSLALQLVRDYNMRLFSGNKTLLYFEDNKMKALAGTSTITIKEEDKFRWQGLINNVVYYWGRMAFQLKKEQYSERDNVQIKKIVLPKINKDVKESKVLPPVPAMHALYPYIMDKVNADTIIGFNIFLGDSPEGAENYLIMALHLALQQTPVYVVAGPMEYLVDQIQEL